MSDIKRKYVEYLTGPDTGISSESMMCAFIGVTNNNRWGDRPPSDPSDFGRCFRLLEKFPEFKDKMELLNKFKPWKQFVSNWDELTKLWLEESPSGRCPKLYELMMKLAGRV